MTSKKRILLIQHEIPKWDHARSWSYGAHLALEEGLLAQGVELVTLVTTWFKHAREICGTEPFDQVWINDIGHSTEPGASGGYQLTEQDMAWIGSLAPIRVGHLIETIFYSDEEFRTNPWLAARLPAIQTFMQYLTHVVTVDELDPLKIEAQFGVPAMWGPVSVPSQFLTDQLFVHTGAPALFSGNPYGERAVLLQHPGLAGLLAFLPSPENQTKLPQIFDQLNGEILAQMLAEPFSMERYMGYLEGLRMVRRQAFQMYIEGLKQGCAVVNLPSFLKGYAGRVVEGMAAGRPVISWEVPERPKTRTLFAEDTEILLYRHDEHTAQNLAHQIRRIMYDPAFAQSLVQGARRKLERFHTTEARVGQILEWVAAGQTPSYEYDASDAPPPSVQWEVGRFFVKPEYRSRTSVAYYEDSEPEQSGVIWQPDVYPLAAHLARQLGCTQIIDIGSGHGQKLVSLYPEFQVMGVDFGPNMAYCSSHYPFGTWLEWNLESSQAIPIDPQIAQQSVVICSDVIEHLVDPTFLLRNIKRLLADVPVVVLSTPERDLTRGTQDMGPPINPCHVREWNLLELKQLLESEGISVDFIGITISNTHSNLHQTTLALLRGERNDRPLLPGASAGDAIHFSGGNIVVSPGLRVGGAGIAGAASQTGPREISSSNDKSSVKLNGQPLVSAIVPTHNRPDLLVRALRSIKEQSYENIEIVVVNDAGSDVENIVNWLGKDANISYVRHGMNRGLAAARNTGLNVARGEIVVYLDDDDVFLSDHVATVVARILESGKPFVYTEAEYVLESAVQGQMKELGRGKPYADVPYSKERLHIGNFIPVNTWGHLKSILTKTGYFDESLDNHEDWDFLLRCSRQFDLVHIPKTTVQVHQRTQADNMLRRERHKFYKTYQLLYSRYDDLGSANVATGRRAMLAQIMNQGEKPAVEINKDSASCEVDLAQNEYRAWRSKRSLQEIDAQLFAERMTLVWKTRPVFQIVLILAPGEEPLLADTLDSLGAQFYSDWRLTVIAGFPAPDAVFHELAQLRWIEARTAADRIAAMNALIAGADTGWLLLAPPGAVLEPHALIRCGDYVNLHPEWRLIYCDDDRINWDGEYIEPRFKPDFNLDLLRSTDYIGPCFIRLGETGGYSFLERAESYDMALRVLDQHGEQAIGHIADVLLHLPGSWDAIGNEENAREAVSQHLVRQGIQGSVDEGYAPGTHRVVYERMGNPLVSIIIPNRDKLEFLQPCVESVFEKTSYTDYEILIVDNQSDDPDVLDYYEELRQRFPDRLRVLSFDTQFNFSAMNNLAAREAKGEYLLLLNNDTQIVQSEWLERLLSYGQRPDVGIVGARLVYPESGILQHAGVVLGMSSIADHPFHNVLSISDPGYMNRAQVDQNYSAVTAACLLVRKSVYEQVGGMDEERLKVLFNDVDLCLKVRELGYKIVWTPYATAVHHGSTSLKSESTDLMKLALGNERAKQERGAMMERWLPQLANDPAYNRHLSFKPPGYQVEGTVVIDWDTNLHDRPRILGSPLSGGSGEYRVIAPFRALSRAGLAQCDVVQAGKMFQTRVLMPVEIERAKPDTLVLHSAIDDKQMEALALYQQYNQDVLRVLTLDDLLSQVPKDNSFYRYSYKDAKPRLRKALSFCDRLIVSTEPLAALCRPMIEDIHIIPNRLESSQWGNLRSLRRQGKKPRVGWAGAQQHKGDLALIVDVVKQTSAEVDWVFFGMCPDELRPYVSEFHDFVLSFYEYPAKLASLNLDLAVAPLEVHAFNEAKSNLRLLEYGILGWPVVCTDVYPYQDAPVKRVPNETSAWVDAIRERINDLDASAQEGDRLKAWVRQNYLLEDHLDQWLRALVR